ncbi:stage II sporulation protein E [Bacillaceae bacterium]
MLRKMVLYTGFWQTLSGKKTWKAKRWLETLGERVFQSARRWGLLHIVMGFLLGRALILQELSPFAVPFFFVVYHVRKDRWKLVALSLLLGASTQSASLAWKTLLSLALAYALLQVMEWLKKRELSYVPAAVFLTIFAAHSIYDYFTQKNLAASDWVMNGVEGLLGLILTLIFVQTLPLLSVKRRHYQLKHEEIICLVILLASVMTGTVGWVVSGMTVENVLSRFLILLFAFVGGGALGAAVGVVTGLILSLAHVEAIHQIGLLAFAGLLAGLLKEGKKPGVVLGLFVGTSILAVYLGQRADISQSLVETGIAAACFFLTPRPALKMIAKFVPGTQEHMQSQQDYLRRIRDVTAGRIRQFSDVFRTLAQSFQQFSAAPAAREEEHTDILLSDVTEKTCQHCWKKKQCWERFFHDTYVSMADVMQRIERFEPLDKSALPQKWLKRCVKADRVIEVMQQENEKHALHRKVNRQIMESRRLVSQQLAGVSKIMSDFAHEIQKETHEMHVQEQQIVDALEGLGLSVRSVEINSLDEGNVDIEVSQPTCYGRDECSKIVAPLLSDILGETITVAHKDCFAYTDGYCTMCLASAKEYVVETGVASAAKDGKLLSGDSYKTLDLGNGKFVLAISDGMGNGERAHLESASALELLQQLLQSGIDESLAIKSVNSVLALRSTDEVFATLDLALIDLHNAHTKFLKIGSTPSFIKRGKQVIPVSANNLPIGIIEEIDVDVVTAKLRPGDVLIMMTDGLYDAPSDIENKEKWMCRMIAELETDEPQEVADCLLEKVIRHHYGQIPDDMTVMVARVDKYLPEWATIQVPGIAKIDRPRTVS